MTPSTSFRPLATLLAIVVTASGLLGASPATAQVRHLGTVPRGLKEWSPWVLYDAPEAVCAQVRAGEHQCAWPGMLSLEIDDKGGRFSLAVSMDAESDLRIPGSTATWPQHVQSGLNRAVVRKLGDHPYVRLSKGDHLVTGEFSWARAPEVLDVAADSARILLTLRGVPVAHPRHDDEGRLWLQGSGDTGETKDTESLRVSTYRRLTDGVPMTVTNGFELNVSGRAREIDLGHVLLAGARPTAVRGPLPVQVSGEGGVKVYVKPGTHFVEIDTVIVKAVADLGVPKDLGEDFDPNEIWVWIPDESLRSVEISGLQAVDPERTTLPKAWRGTGTAYLASPGGTLKLAVSRKGEVESAPNSVRLTRALWMDLDGDGYTVRDELSGTVNQGWRLNYEGGQLGRVTHRGNGSDLLITEDPGHPGVNGVELREANLNIAAESRIEGPVRHVQAVGWDADVQFLSATLNLPPGWELIGGQGVDQMKGTWIESWTLFDFFFVLMVALTLGKLCGWHWALLALLGLILSHGQGEAPEWIWIQLLASLALLRVLPEHWLRKGIVIYRYVILVSLVIVLAPYARDQARFALHPQVEHGGMAPNDGQGFSGRYANLEVNEAPVAVPATKAPAPMEQAAMAKDGDARTRDKQARKKSAEGLAVKSRGLLGGSGPDIEGLVLSSKTDYTKRDPLWVQQVDPNAIVQTGPGVPTWSWSQWNLTWDGPVRRDHEVSLWLVSPTWNRILTILRLILLIAMALLLINRRDMSWRKGDEGGAPKASGEFWRSLLGVTLLIGAAALTTTLGAPEAQAQQPQAMVAPAPSPELLKTLRARLLAEGACEGPCAVASRLDIRVSESAVVFQAEVHAQQPSAWFIPGPADPLRIDEVKVDGMRTGKLRREPGGLVAVRLSAGRHLVEVSGTLVNRDVVTIQLDEATKPQRVTFSSEDWSVDGISDTGLPDNSLQLTRMKKGDDQAGTPGAEMSTELPPWFSVQRHLALGLPWQLRTTVRRTSAERPTLVKLPLVEGEKVITDGTRVEDGQVVVDFPRGIAEVVYTSEVPISKRVELAAATEQPWTETWSVECSRIWRCQFSELGPVKSVSDGIYRPLWRPWPGEKLAIDVLRPQGTPGQAATVDRVDYTITPGKRLLEAQLELSIRASQGGWQKVTLPPDAELQSVTINSKNQNIRPTDGVLNLPVIPGAQTIKMVWQQPWDRHLRESMPPILIGSKAVNANLRINLGEDRWVLWVTGPKWGPAVLYWSHLLILLLAAILLGRLKKLPLKTYEWLLLALGMAQLPVVVMLLPVGWFIALAWRQRRPLKPWWQFDGVQVALVLMTVIAMGSLYAAIHANLLFDVDMQVKGAGSSNHVLRWYVDQIDGTLPEPSVVSLPLLAWRIGMLVWALWLVSRLLKWVPWGWRAFSHEALWRSLPSPSPRPPKGGTPPTGHGPGGGGAPRSLEPDAPYPQRPQSADATSADDTPTEQLPRGAVEAPAVTEDGGDAPSADETASADAVPTAPSGAKTQIGLAVAHIDELHSSGEDDNADPKRRLASGTREAMLKALRDRKAREADEEDS